jgi:hypothetical protein
MGVSVERKDGRYLHLKSISRDTTVAIQTKKIDLQEFLPQHSTHFLTILNLLSFDGDMHGIFAAPPS